jgi:hypothetical protein
VETQASQAFVETQASQAFVETQASQAFVETQASQAFVETQASQAFVETQASQAFVETQASQAFVETQVPQTLPLSLDDDGVSDGIDTKSLVLQETEASQILLPFSKQKYGTTLEELAMAYSQPEDNASPHGKKRPCPSNENNDNLLPVKYTKIV